ncbi:uncharacterized protein LAJ45_09706 [Morchella importuna]|uniref:uncharacterized protein n=1 Tax=Morchella importuna TaxID=1174673 RepID=UPI001E8DECBB|nr:uncharacterized protein LAJ45_09706 [Morchella importuna]KAH8146264.1 hypothetical protein LAJ45_09706 [Morchella importuna]
MGNRRICDIKDVSTAVGVPSLQVIEIHIGQLSLRLNSSESLPSPPQGNSQTGRSGVILAVGTPSILRESCQADKSCTYVVVVA